MNVLFGHAARLALLGSFGTLLFAAYVRHLRARRNIEASSSTGCLEHEDKPVGRNEECVGKESKKLAPERGLPMKFLKEWISILAELKLAWLLPLACCAAVSLGQTPQQQAWNILQAGVSDKSTGRRTQAVRALGLLRGNQRAPEMVQTALQDKEPEVRAAAATALGQMGSTASIPKLRKMLSDNEASVVLAAAHALRVLNDPVAYEVFYEVLTGERKSAGGLVGQGMETLKDRKKIAKFGFEEGIGFIPYADIGYSAVKAVTKDDASPVRAAAANILAGDPDPRSAEALVQAVSDKKWIVRVAALEAIAKRGEPNLQSGILPAMSDGNEAVRFTAAAAVFRLSAIAKAMGLAKSKPSRPARQTAPRTDKSQ
jgi:HEAT repeat protein